jgi:hypothetical protein
MGECSDLYIIYTLYIYVCVYVYYMYCIHIYIYIYIYILCVCIGRELQHHVKRIYKHICMYSPPYAYVCVCVCVCVFLDISPKILYVQCIYHGREQCMKTMGKSNIVYYLSRLGGII